MSVRKRQWTTAKGSVREAWVVDYTDANGRRRLRTFQRKKEADAFSATARVEVAEGTHVPDKDSVTVSEAGELWIARAAAAGLERVTLDSYRQQLDLHIKPLIGSTKLNKLTIPAVRAFEDRLRKEGRSTSMIRRLMGTLGSIVADSQERGLIVRNPVRELRRQRGSRERRSAARQRGKLKVGADIPTPTEVRAIIKNAKGRWRPLLLTAIFCGLRASELRGLRWRDLDLKGRTLHVRQRADRYGHLGPPKSEAGERSLPLPSRVVSELKAWRRECPKGELELVFPNGAGNVENMTNIVTRGLQPTLIAAGVTAPMLDKDGTPVLGAGGEPQVRAKYTGMHALRHFFASWCINRKKDGGLELPPKMVQERMGHATFALTMDTYGHLFPGGDDRSELDAAERALLGQ